MGLIDEDALADHLYEERRDNYAECGGCGEEFLREEMFSPDDGYTYFCDVNDCWDEHKDMMFGDKYGQ